MKAIFPFGAVVGQERLKLALLLCAIDPAVGGVLVRGPRGVAKTTLARAFAELLTGRFVELPLGATEERVAGSLDLGKALGKGDVEFSPGLLARAHEGVLYVDEINLLPDALVDLLLDAAASGTNIVERDGISHSHPARFVLVGTMNPEEGELRPQLVDRFGLSVHADGEIAPAARTAIVLRRLEFERDPAAFRSAFETERRALAERCARARERAVALAFEGPGVQRVAELCHAARVEGVRADLAMLRAARAHAAWNDRREILVSDVDAVAELALGHRRRPERGSPGQSAPPSPTERAGGSPPAAGSDRASSRSHDAKATTTASQEATRQRAASQPAEAPATRGSSSAGSDRGALPAVPVRALDVPQLPAWVLSAPPRAPSRTPPLQRRRQGRTGARTGAIDWIATLLGRPRPKPADVRRRLRRLRPERVWIVALDCSASMLRGGSAGLAKGIARAIASHAARHAARVALISFGGSGAQRESANENAGRLAQVIGALEVGGGTPLARALALALDVQRDPSRYFPSALRRRGAGGTLESRLFLITDGRTRETLGPSLEAWNATSSAHSAIVLDCERGPVRLSRGSALAQALGGVHLRVDSLFAGRPTLGLSVARE